MTDSKQNTWVKENNFQKLKVSTKEIHYWTVDFVFVFRFQFLGVKIPSCIRTGKHGKSLEYPYLRSIL